MANRNLRSGSLPGLPTSMHRLLHTADDLTRRQAVARMASSLLGVGLTHHWLGGSGFAAPPTRPPKAGATTARKATAKNVIYLYMDGGMSHLDTLDPKPGGASGPTKAIKTKADGVLLGDFLPLVADQMHHGIVIRSLTSTQGAHQQGNYFLHTSYANVNTIRHPMLGAWLSHFRGDGNPTLPKTVFIGNNSRPPSAGFLPPEHQPLFLTDPKDGLENVRPLSGLGDADLAARLQLAAAMDASFRQRYPHRSVAAYADMYDSAVATMRSKDLVAFDLTQERPDVRERYGKNHFGQGCLLARRLVKHGVRFVEISMHGWDTHADNFKRLDGLCGSLDAGLSSLVADLHSDGLLDETLVVVATEFGRSPEVNGNVGRDHFPKAFSFALFGGGVKAGSVFGRTDDRGADVEDGMMTIPDFNATIAQAMGLPVDEVVYSPSNRPFKIADDGRPVAGIFA